jgi:hypothetical protein
MSAFLGDGDGSVKTRKRNRIVRRERHMLTESARPHEYG